MIFDLKHVKYEIVTPALKSIGLASLSAINEVTGIGLVESGYRTRRQTGGPALGFWQMEPATEQDCWKNFLAYRPLLAGLLRKLCDGEKPGSGLLLTRDLYAAAMCRVKLFRASEPLPIATDARALCQYWKNHYNTALGAGQCDPDHIALFQQAIDA